MKTPTGDGGEAPAGDDFGGEDDDSRPVAGDGGEEDEQLLREEELAMEEEEPASSDPATEGVSHGSPTPVEVEGTSVTRNGEEMGGEQPDLELRSRAVNNGGNGSSSSSPRDFNLDEFLTLAHKVIDHGDSQAMDALNELKRRWEARFGIEKSRLPAESLNVDEHPFAHELKQVCRRRTTQATTSLGTRMAATLQRRPAVRGRIITPPPPPPAASHSNNPNQISAAALSNANQTSPAVLHSSNANLPSPAALHSSNENQISPATVGIPTKDDVCNIANMVATVDNVGADVAGKVSDMEACLEHTADISPGRADIITTARADIIAAARADIIAAPRADDTGASRANVSNYTIKSRADIIDDTRKARADINADTCKNRADVSNSMERNQAMHDAPLPTGLYVGNIPLHAYPNTIIDDKIAHAFNHSTRKTLSFIAPTMQNGEVVVRPSLDAVRNGSKRWKSTAVGYFLGKRPYYHHLKEFAHSVWSALREVTATTNGFFFFQFKTVIDMEDIIEGGPWLFQGQPIVLQKWEPGMAMRKLKHTQVPVWIKLRHLPMEFWTTEVLSTVASGVGKPLYPDAITRACTRLDFARVCVMIDATQKLHKHIIVMAPDEEGGEKPCKVDVEYEWLPPKCTACMSLGHSNKDCTLNKTRKPTKPTVNVYVPKVNVAQPQLPTKGHKTMMVEDIPKADAGDRHVDQNHSKQEERGKAIVIYNAFDALHLIDDAGEHSGGPNTSSPMDDDPYHQLALKDLVSEYRLHFLGILETRVRLNNVMHIQSFLLPHWKWFVDYSSVGNRIWLAWDENIVDVHILDSADQFIHCRVTNMADNESVIITVVYGASEVIDRRNLWTALETLAQQCSDIPWMVGGDFNTVRDLNEVCGISGDIRMATEEFNAGILEAGLIPLPMQGEWFTWHNCSTSMRSLWKRLDRILINDRWLARFPSAYYHSLTPRTSDHSPLVLHGDIQQHNGGMFRFDNYLAHSPEFIHNVQNIWHHEIVGIPMYAVTRKLKALKPVFRLQRRNKGDLTMNVQLAKGFLDEAQQLVSSDRQNELYLLLEHCCRVVYAKAAKLEQIMLQQRAKMQWMKDGDQCSRVFFRKIAQRRVMRRILQINDENGFTHTDLGEIAHEFVSYYQNLLGGTRRRLSVDIRYLRPWARHCITDEEANQLLLPLSADDVKQAVFDIADDKAPGPDGYSSRFFKAAWPVVGEEVTRAVLDFFSTRKLLKQINSTILALIPKVHTPMSVNDFRPISCCNVLYKIIAKLLVQKISVLLDKIVSPCQTAFIPGRSIGDNIMLAQELFSRYNQMRLPPRCALKVDIRKAYDTVEWDFLLAVLQLFGFPPTFTRWIEECVSTTSFSIGLNGKPHGFFAGARGLRQGDPLSPYLFVLVMEALHLGFLQRIEQDIQFTYHWKCESSKVFQMGFADDLLLLCKADLDSIRVFKEGLDWFAELSGLRLNVQKSHLIISRSAQNLKDQMLDILGFQEGHLPMRYLGLPLISSRLTISDCQPLISKIDARINGWEGISLSYAGRVQIIKSVLSALSLYWASAFILPKKVINEIEKRLRTFLWKGTTSSGYAKVAWKDVCRPMDEGGLGFKDISTLNRALMSKKLCDVIHGSSQDRLRERSIWTIREHGGSWGWRKILRLRPFLRAIVDYQIGNGDRFFVWQDLWHHLGPLIERFPQGPRHLRLEESAKLSLVISAGEWQWPTITDFECLEITHNLPLIFGGEDRVVWRCDEGQPTTQALYRLFTHPEPKVGWSSLLLGSLKIPRHSLILWLAILSKLPTTDKSWLSHLGVCILCDEGATESHPHLFFRCRFSRQCLYEIRRRIRFHWPNRDWATDIEWATRKWRGKHRAYRTLLAACVYHIWKERNLRRFDHTERTPATLSILIINDVRQRILSVDLASSVGTRALYRLWRIPWVEGETS
ncbi:UNVERIFIED_CONTAM: hypothetical protein Sindi_1284200 [Sesamum indicum]